MLDDEITKLINDLRAGDYTRFSGGTSHFDFKLDREAAEKAVRDFLANPKKQK